MYQCYHHKLLDKYLTNYTQHRQKWCIHLICFSIYTFLIFLYVTHSQQPDIFKLNFKKYM